MIVCGTVGTIVLAAVTSVVVVVVAAAAVTGFDFGFDVVSGGVAWHAVLFASF